MIKIKYSFESTWINSTFSGTLQEAEEFVYKSFYAWTKKRKPLFIFLEGGGRRFINLDKVTCIDIYPCEDKNPSKS